jgi:hypothetical protein
VLRLHGYHEHSFIVIVNEYNKAMIEVFADLFQKKKSLQTSRDGIEKYTGESGPYVFFLSRLFQSVGTLP